MRRDASGGAEGTPTQWDRGILMSHPEGRRQGSSGILSEELLTPEQFQDLWHRSRTLIPERVLAAAVLWRAVMDLQKFRYTPHPKKPAALPSGVPLGSVRRSRLAIFVRESVRHAECLGAVLAAHSLGSRSNTLDSDSTAGAESRSCSPRKVPPRQSRLFGKVMKRGRASDNALEARVGCFLCSGVGSAPGACRSSKLVDRRVS